MRLLRSLILAFLFLNIPYINAQESHDFEISKNLDIYTSLIQQLDLHYVDEMHAGTMTKTAIDAMLKHLDPYTVYYPESMIEDVRFLQTGKYGGVGAAMHIKDGDIVVGMTYPGFPFNKSGLRAGDILTSINGENIHGNEMREISEYLKGAAGTDLSVVYKSAKDGLEKTVNLKREEIIVKDVPFFTLLEDSIAYVKLVGFKQNAAKEVKMAIDSLNRNNNVKAVILDLRNNGGGLLIQAVNILDLFVSQGETIVSTKGKTRKENFTYKTRRQAAYPNMKVVVLVNKHSASASEIVAGSFQDLDRGVIMGQKSFGKGLVQKVFPLSYRSQVKITVAKYYIPSGRCIQSLDYIHKDANGRAIKTPDSLMATFKTKGGRLVKDAGGIIPDIKLEEKYSSDIVSSLIRNYEIFDFATKYVYSHDSIMDIKDFKIDDELYNEFISFVNADSFNFTLPIEVELKKLRKFSDEKNYDIASELDALESKIEISKKNIYDENKQIIRPLIKEELASRYFFDSGRVEVMLQDDKEVLEAIDILNDNHKYSQILQLK